MDAAFVCPHGPQQLAKLHGLYDGRKRLATVGCEAFFQALVITLREGFEAFLIVAISLAYLRKSGRSRARLWSGMEGTIGETKSRQELISMSWKRKTRESMEPLWWPDEPRMLWGGPHATPDDSHACLVGESCASCL